MIDFLLGWVIPGGVLTISTLVTWLLYRHFARHPDDRH